MNKFALTTFILLSLLLTRYVLEPDRGDRGRGEAHEDRNDLGH